MKKLFLLLALAVISFVHAQTWKPVTNEKGITPLGERVIIPKKYKVFHLVDDSFKNALWASPDEKQVNLANSPAIIELPMPDGSLKKFRVVQSPVMAPELAAQFPNIKTFNVIGIDEPGISGKLDWTEMGFHAMLRRPGGDIFIDPFCRTNSTDYISYYKYDLEKDPKYVIAEEGGDVVKPASSVNPTGKKKENGAVEKTEAITCVGATLRTYRLAVACTGEYAVAATGQSSPTVAQTLSAIVTTVNRVDGVYETDLAIKMVLVATETVVVYTNASTDPFTGNNNANTLINESQTVIDNNIGDANYDVGHTFSTGGGGLSTLGGVCTTGQKAQSITGSPQPTGDGYDIDYVAHEMGHDFGGNHTFRAVTGSCSGNQNPGTMVEPGSGITIMAYAGICSPNDDSAHSIPYFHAISYDEIVAYTNSGAGNGCPVHTASNNHPPVVTASPNYVVPASTPFSLTGSAIDPDNDVLTYSWEEIDN
ncbi:MAG TPA: zinc-dependent metalloprotease family protein, partial [Bacteroidia bacterium]|nr:zinc-dependent metalloprotease family protein [Bacteroidia bacterium]